jgi:hypothetical protein
MTATSLPAAIPRSRQAARRPRGAHVPLPVALALLPALFVLALLAPIPALPNAARIQVADSVADRLPGWSIVRTSSSWEGGWTVVAACGPSRLGFQWVPGHGLRPGDAWLHPQDEYARNRLSATSDDARFLVWLSDVPRLHALSCQQELARSGAARPRMPLD